MIYITAPVKIRKKVQISDLLTIAVLPSDVEHLKEPFQLHSYRSTPSRYLLENCQISHKDVVTPKSLGKNWVEQELLVIKRKNNAGCSRSSHFSQHHFPLIKALAL